MADISQVPSVASQIDTSTPGGIVAAISIAIAGLGVGGLKLKQMWRGDNTDAKNTAREQAYLDGVSARVKDLEAKVEKLTEEKLEAEKRAIKLEAQVEGFIAKLAHIEEEKVAIRALLHDIQEKYEKVVKENDAFRNTISDLNSQLALAEAKLNHINWKERPEQAVPLQPISSLPIGESNV